MDVFLVSTGFSQLENQKHAHKLTPLPFPSCRQQKLVHVDTFLLSAGSPPLEKQKHTHGDMFLLFVGSSSFPTMPTSETCPQGHDLMLAGFFHIPHLPF